jgi:hypothetical protein
MKNWCVYDNYSEHWDFFSSYDEAWEEYNNAVTVIKTDAEETAAAFIFQIVEWEEVEK